MNSYLNNVAHSPMIYDVGTNEELEELVDLSMFSRNNKWGELKLKESNPRIRKTGKAVATVTHHPIVQAAAHAGIHAALENFSEEELEDLSMLSSIKHGVSHVAYNPIVQAAANAAAQATFDAYRY